MAETKNPFSRKRKTATSPSKNPSAHWETRGKETRAKDTHFDKGNENRIPRIPTRPSAAVWETWPETVRDFYAPDRETNKRIENKEGLHRNGLWPLTPIDQCDAISKRIDYLVNRVAGERYNPSISTEDKENRRATTWKKAEEEARELKGFLREILSTIPEEELKAHDQYTVARWKSISRPEPEQEKEKDDPDAGNNLPIVRQRNPRWRSNKVVVAAGSAAAGLALLAAPFLSPGVRRGVGEGVKKRIVGVNAEVNYAINNIKNDLRPLEDSQAREKHLNEQRENAGTFPSYPQPTDNNPTLLDGVILKYPPSVQRMFLPKEDPRHLTPEGVAKATGFYKEDGTPDLDAIAKVLGDREEAKELFSVRLYNRDGTVNDNAPAFIAAEGTLTTEYRDKLKDLPQSERAAVVSSAGGGAFDVALSTPTVGNLKQFKDKKIVSTGANDPEAWKTDQLTVMKKAHEYTQQGKLPPLNGIRVGGRVYTASAEDLISLEKGTPIFTLGELARMNEQTAQQASNESVDAWASRTTSSEPSRIGR